MSDSNKNNKLIGTLLVVAAGLCWGIIGVSSRKLQAHNISSIQITWIRCFITAVGMLLIIVTSNYKHLIIKLSDIWMFIGTGICSIAFFNICYFKAIGYTTLAVAAILLYTAPAIVVILSCVFLGEKLTKKKAIALVFATLGCILSTGVTESDISISTLGILFGLGSGIGYALYSIFGAVALKKYTSMTVTFYTFFIAALALIPVTNITSIVAVAKESGEVIAYSLILGVFSTLLPFLCYTRGLTYLKPGQASIIAFVEPLVATICGALIFKEALSIASGIGLILMFGSIILLNINIIRKTNKA